jgi:MFS family permease
MSLFGMSRTATVMCIFFVQSVIQGAWFPRIADIQLGLGLTEGALGLALVGAPVGALLTFPLSAPIVERFGTRNTLLVSLPCFALSLAAATLAVDALSLFWLAALTGVGHGITQIAMNVEADRLEAASGRRVMNRCHAMWSLGILTSSLIGTLLRGLGVPPAPHLFAMVPFAVLAIWVVAGRMDAAPPRPHAGPLKRRLFAMPTLPILALIGFSLCAVLVEGGAYGWSVIYLRDNFLIPVWVETLTLPAFLTAMMAARLVSDRLVEQHGPAKVAFWLSAVVFVGLLPVAWAGSLHLALLGFAFMGFGVAAAFPLAISAAARLGDRPASDNLVAFTMLQRILFLVTPPLVGIIATQNGLAFAFACMLPFPLLSMLLARYLEPRERLAPSAR